MAVSLLQYLNNRSSTVLDGIVKALENVIEVEHLYDPNNTLIVLANKELETALNVPSCHRAELRDVVAKRLDLTQKVNYTFPHPPPELYKRFNVNPSPYRGLLSIRGGFHANLKVVCRPKLATFVHSLPNVDTKKNIFTYTEVCELIHTYLQDRSKAIIDERSPHVANFGRDPLGEVLGVLACHRRQIIPLLQEQLIPYYD